MYKYKRVEYKLKFYGEVDTQLNMEGKNGWEVIYYNEQKPKKFGEDIILTVLYKRKKNIIRQLLSG